MSCNYSAAASSSCTSSLPSIAASSTPSSSLTGSLSSTFISSLPSVAASSTPSSNLTGTLSSSFTSSSTSSFTSTLTSTFTTVTTSSSITSVVPPLSPLPQGSSKCPANFRNTVFNTVATKDSGWSSRWSTIAGMGVSSWIGFTGDPISSSSSYNNAASAGAVDSAQIKICMDPSKVTEAVSLITGPSPPTYLELFNEPDFSFMGYTPLTDAVSAAAALGPIFSATTTTQFLSPAVAFTNSDWLTTFAARCNNCMDKIPIISAHVYATDPAAAINQIEILHSTWPSKRIWVTELAPASSNDQGCNLDDNGVINWMQTVVPRLVGLGYVDRIFWNTGEHSSMSPCNPSLTNADGSATALLKAYGSICS